MLQEFELKVPALYQPARIDAWLAAALDKRFSRQEIKRALQEGLILLNGKIAKPSLAVKENDVILGRVSTDRGTPLVPENIPLKVVYEDDDLFVIDKPAGMVVHPGAGNKTGTLVHALLGRGTTLSSEQGEFRPGIVHRLDKETSGLLVVAKHNAAHRLLQEQFKWRTLTRVYTALVKGRVSYEEGRVEISISRDPKVGNKMAVSRREDAKEAETHYRVLKRFKQATLIEARLMTGRTHQIRVHMAHIGHPVVNDSVYGTRGKTDRHALHASRIQFIHPTSQKTMQFESPWPEDFAQMVREAEAV